MKFRSRPVEKEACQFFENTPHIHGDGACPLSAISWEYHPGMGHTGPCPSESCAKYPRRPVIRTLEGPHHVSNGDWIVRGLKGEHYAVKPDIFDKTYEEVSYPSKEPQS